MVSLAATPCQGISPLSCDLNYSVLLLYGGLGGGIIERILHTYKPEEKCRWVASGEPRGDDGDRGHRLSAQAARGAPARRRRCRVVAALGWAHAQPRGPVDTPAAAAGDYLKRWALPSLYNPLHSSAARSKGTHLCLLRQLAEAPRSETVSPRIEHQLRSVPGPALRALPAARPRWASERAQTPGGRPPPPSARRSRRSVARPAARTSARPRPPAPRASVARWRRRRGASVPRCYRSLREERRLWARRAAVKLRRPRSRRR